MASPLLEPSGAALLGFRQDAAASSSSTTTGKRPSCHSFVADRRRRAQHGPGRRSSSAVAAAFKCCSRSNDPGKLFLAPRSGGARGMFESREKLSRNGGCSVEEASLAGKTAGMAAAFWLGFGVQYGDVEAMAGLLPAAFPWEKRQEQLEPSKGTCATCIGVVDETLGICNATANCVSSFDDRPRFFVAPWEFPGQLPVAVEELRRALMSAGANIEEQAERYVHAVFTSNDGIVDDVEFLFSKPTEDKIVVIRSASRATRLEDQQRNRNRLEEIRKSLTWEQVPILRNRKRVFFFLESPWDTFGPEPPPSFDFKDDLKFRPE